jgi:hypothetical protein
MLRYYAASPAEVAKFDCFSKRFVLDVILFNPFCFQDSFRSKTSYSSKESCQCQDMWSANESMC